MVSCKFWVYGSKFWSFIEENSLLKAVKRVEDTERYKIHLLWVYRGKREKNYKVWTQWSEKDFLFRRRHHNGTNDFSHMKPLNLGKII